ncbi:TonB-dependent receptor family protein [Sinomicrobium kalidii]|uniref:outer membrane beta-barrel family protein n=1 Tax=Sinomicrobium kalidii TaxID=2900738 RepID=UPI001E645F86|nr:outer membrane beta-barrel family protein [Sinomicrobium kalidii]UGU16581.1 TonB-dependent receptor family protein [Sinomicrobium kalidii]
MKSLLKIALSGILLCSGHFLMAQERKTVTGTIVDAANRDVLPYATVVITEVSSGTRVTGTTTDENGDFEVSTTAADFLVEISFMGYQNKTVRDFDTRQTIDLGEITLSPDAEALDEVVIEGERSTVEFKLDKRVFNVGSDISSTGAGAMDVLNNVPSVNVSIEGEISLRGNTGVQILINGKPSVLADEQSNALGTITADMIESIEVITNPSAKYEAEGTSGILNIILKKEEKKGFNGSVSANTGTPDNHSIGVSLNRRTDNFNFFTQFGAGYRSLPSDNESINSNLLDNTEVRSNGTEYRNEAFFNITLGTDYYINDYNTLTLSGNFAYEKEDQPSETTLGFFNAEDVLTSEYLRDENTTANNPKYQYDLQYKKQFRNNEDHVLLFSTLGSFFGKDQSSEFTNTPTVGSGADPDQRTATDFYQHDFVFKLDYTNPFSEQFTLETGAAYEINNVGNEYAVFNLENDEWIADESLTNNFEYKQKVLGFYGTGAYEGEKFGVKLGLRMENTDLNTLLTGTNEENEQNYTNFFPSAHTSYKLSDNHSLQLGYTRRISRPRLWDLNPFFNIRNNYNVRRGNPDLQPEFADSYEITGIFIFEKASLNSSVYHLYTTDVVERVSTFENNVNITMPMNIGTNRKTGLEINGKYTPVRIITLSGDFNYGFFQREGNYEEQNFDFSGDQWSLRLNSKIKLPADFDLELTGNYESGYPTVQGEVSGFAFADVGIRKRLWNGKTIVNMGVRDIFASRIRESYVYQEDFSVYDFSKRGRFFTLGISYSFGKGEAMTYSGRR